MKMEDRRLPRPIGGERSWKASGTGLGSLGQYSQLDLDPSLPLPPAMSQNMNSSGSQQGNSWIGMYGSGNSTHSQGGSGFNTPSQQGQHLFNMNSNVPLRGNGGGAGDVRNFLGRRLTEDDPSRLFDYPQQVRVRILMGNGIL